MGKCRPNSSLCGMKDGLFNPFFTGNYSNPYYYSGGDTPDPSPTTPIYDTLGNVEAIYDSTGLVVGTNDYGQVTSAMVIGAAGWKSLAPGPTGRDMLPVLSAGSTNAITVQMVGDIPVVDCNGFGRLRNTSGAANFNFLHYNATFANLKWTIHILFRPGFGADPGEVYGIIGNNGRSGINKGFTATYDDRDGISLTNNLGTIITKGTAGFISTSSDNNKITPNVWQVLTLEFDGALTAANRMQAMIDKVSVPITVTSASTAVVTTPTYDLELFSNGNGVAIMTGQMSHVVIQSRKETSTVRDAFIDSLLPWKTALNTGMATEVNNRIHIYNTLAEDLTRNFLSSTICQSPLDSDVIVRFFTDGDSHVIDATKKISLQKSIDKGLTWSAKSTVYDPVGDLCVQDPGGGYTNSGRLFIISDTHTASDPNYEPHGVTCLFSDNDGDSFTTVDLTSVLPADGLNSWRMYGNLIDNGGYLMYPFFKFPEDPNTLVSAAIYLFKIANDADPTVLGNWSVKTIMSDTAGFISEPAIIQLSATKLICIARDETTKEWNLFESLDNGETWTDDGALTFNETLVSAGPVKLKRFIHNGVDVTVCYHPDRNGRVLKATYGKTGSLITNSITGWAVGTKTTVAPDFFHYGDVVHYDNDLQAIGFYAREPNPFSGTANRLCAFHMPTFHEATIETELGI